MLGLQALELPQRTDYNLISLKSQLSFQAVLMTDGVHSFAIFNYGSFDVSALSSVTGFKGGRNKFVNFSPPKLTSYVYRIDGKK